MSRVLLALVIAALLAACSKWDAASERAACDRAYPSDKSASENCYAKNKLAHDTAFAQMWRQR